MPAKRSTRFTVKPYVKQFTKFFSMKHFAMNHFTVKRPAAIGIIVVCIVGTAILIVSRSSEPTSAASITPAVETTAAAPINQTTPVARTQKPFAVAKAPAAQDPGTVAGAQVATIEGCLVQDDHQYQLKNTSGEDAPKARSWKSGFLHKGSQTVDVMDPSHRMNLARHVGERVTITGMLGDRELQGTYLKRVAESCK